MTRTPSTSKDTVMMTRHLVVVVVVVVVGVNRFFFPDHELAPNPNTNRTEHTVYLRKLMVGRCSFLSFAPF